MPSSHVLVATILDETLACQNLNTPQSKGRSSGAFAPIGPHLGRGYPTTDTATEALSELADRVRTNDPALKVSISRDEMRRLASEVFGELLNELAAEPDRAQHWPKVRATLNARARTIGQKVLHYVPVWLFLGQECEAFTIGPVRLIPRSDWLEVISVRRGRDSEWMAGVRALWAGQKLKQGCWRAAVLAAFGAFTRMPLRPLRWARAYKAGVRESEPPAAANARTVASLVHPDQWIACSEVNGFSKDESRRRGLLAARVALDTVRLVLPTGKKGLTSTAADSILPVSTDRLSQVASEDLAHGWRFNRPGISGAPGLAEDIVSRSVVLFRAAGACIADAVSTHRVHACPRLAERWFNAAHWYGRACLADEDFVAVVMMVISLDVLSGGLQDTGILELIARLTGTPMSHVVLPDGTTLKKLVERTYKLRSEVAHGSVLAVHEPLDLERAQLEELGSIALRNYAIELESYAGTGGTDDRDAFRKSLPAVIP